MGESETNSKPSSHGNRFLRCFGFSRKGKPSREIPSEQHESPRKHRLLSSSKSLFKNTARKTVPVETTGSEKSYPSEKNRLLKSHVDSVADLKLQTKLRKTANSALSQTPRQTSIERWYGSQRDIILENGKSSHVLDVSKDDSHGWPKRFSFSRAIDAVRLGFSQPGSPDLKRSLTQTRPPPQPGPSASALMSHSISLPTSTGPKIGLRKRSCDSVNFTKAGSNNAGLSDLRRVPSRSATTNPHKRVDPSPESPKKNDALVGMSILTVVLMMIFICGKLWAIVLTSAWLYFVPKLRVVEEPGDGAGDPDLSSEEYKKRVVLEGLLERKRHRNGL